MTDGPEHLQGGPELTPVDFDPFAGEEVVATVLATESQQELWVSSQMGPEASCALNESVSIRLRGPLDAAAMTSAVQELARRHEALRGSFSPDGATLCIASDVEIPIETIDLRDVPESEREARLSEAIQRGASRPFDLVKGPLFRVQIVRMTSEGMTPEEHVVILGAHHIVCDGWSIDVVLKDLGDIYSALQRGTTPDLAEVGRFSAYADAQRQELGSETARDAEDYWLRQFADPVPPLDLPADYPRPPIRTYDAARVEWRADPALATALRRTGSRLGCSLFTMLFAGWQAFLHRISGQDDLVVGVPSAGQPVVGQHDLVGHCVNFLPLRSRFDPTRSFADYARSVASAMLDASEHQVFSYGRLLKTIRFPRDPGRIPLVSVSFTHSQKYAEGAVKFEGLTHDYSLNPRCFETFDLQMNAREAGGALEFLSHFNTNMFEHETVERWLGEYEALLKGAAENADTPLAKLPLLTEEERKEIETWNATETDYPREACVHHLFEDQAARTPDRIAVEFEDESLTYEELNRRADRLAARLRRAGAQRGNLVAIYVERSLDIAIGPLAVLKSGAAYVPLDPMFPRERIEFMIQDANAAVVLTQKAILGDLPACPNATIVVSDESHPSETADNAAAADSVPPSSEDPAYVIYTSGSTGKPKGVEIPHRALVNFLLSVKETPGLEQDDVLPCIATLSFDIAALEIYLPLIVGARTVIVSREASLDHTVLMRSLEKTGATAMQVTPASWRLLIDSGWEGIPGLKAFSGGEALSRDLADKILDRVGELWNFYGPTETTVYSSVERVGRAPEAPRLGLPMANTQFHVLDPRREPLPIGVPGEIWIGGDGVATGYLNRPELTAEKFIPDPFSKTPGKRLYGSGDLVRRLPDGRFEFLGRLDHQVKVRGYRIELGEVESLLREYPGVLETAVVAREDVSGDARLVAYFVADPAAQPSPTDLRGSLAHTLPEYMIPSAFVRLESFPLTPNGKLDRRALPAPDSHRPDLLADYVAPRTDLERSIAAVWKEALRLEKVGVYDNFFELGGHSLLLVHVHTELRPILGDDVPVVAMFQYPSIDALSRFLAADKDSGETDRQIRERGARQREAMSRREKALKRKATKTP
ncbi:amino acid adenylation domain-containing protein [Candidatus Sumerlaeota bacterium]|nr:amino acid adenylation domain-containing protein [Candidatus Sumerlaeota bacterium]